MGVRDRVGRAHRDPRSERAVRDRARRSRSVAWAGCSASLGNAIGMLPLIGVVALGVGGSSPSRSSCSPIIKFVGARTWYSSACRRSAIAPTPPTPSTWRAPPRSHWRQLGEGFIVGVTNPKTIAFFVAVLPQFVIVQRRLHPAAAVRARRGLHRARPHLRLGVGARRRAARDWFGVTEAPRTSRPPAAS